MTGSHRGSDRSHRIWQPVPDAGISIRIDHEPGLELLHDKVAIIDSHIIITGSFNWSNEANLMRRNRKKDALASV